MHAKLRIGNTSRRGTRPGFEATHPVTHQRPVPTGVEGAGGICRSAGGRWRGLSGLRGTRPGCGAHGQQEHHRHPYFARNLSRSFFETPQKRCNSNDAHSMFEQAAGELRAKLMGGGGAWPGFEAQGLAAVPVGGGRARAGLEIDHSERSSRVAISRAGRRPPAHTAAGTSGARNTRGATSNTINEAGHRPRRSPAHETGHAAPGTPMGPQATTRENKNRRPRRICGFIVREGGVEPPLHHWNTDLNRARLPIPPLARTQKE